ncbi:Protein kinase domain-containing protein [Parelaphostrongylus tenuis]|uniref:Protein kinase domain-containing protein n=1 Tax=Parelaphostrongylus tenuis TaxID=148309 RepID=A0AAD5R490_PARTN|nr:Protein kinase domain-containing protein [Parelaphostrongylus tenuis]
MQSAPASIHSSQSPEPKPPSISTKGYAKKRERGGLTGILLHTIGKNGSVSGVRSTHSTINGTAIIIKTNDEGTSLPQQSVAAEQPRYVDRTYEGIYDELPLSYALPGRYPPIVSDTFHSRHAGPPDYSPLNYSRPRHYDESYRRHDDGPLSPGRYANTEYRDDYRIPPSQTYSRTPGSGLAEHNYYSSNASPSISSKLDENQSWASEPKRFEVYKTRAERDAERNCITPAGAPFYRPASYYSSASDRPTNTFSYRKLDDPYKVDMHRSTDYYRNRYDDGLGYRRGAYEFEIAGAGQPTPSLTSITQESNAPILNRIRQTARRMPSTESERYSYTRARSMDRKHPMGEELGYGAELRARLISPEPVGDYTYVHYHDSSNGRANGTKDEKRLPRSILKKKQSGEEQRSEVADNFSRRSEDVTVGPVRSVIDRLRRHLSMEKSASPQGQIMSQQLGSGAGVMTSLTTTNGNKDSQDRGFDNSSKKKRSLLSFNRRRTSEVRVDSDGKLVTNGCDDAANYKRPNSPMDKIKSLFRKSEAPSVPSGLSNSDYYSSRYTGGTVSDKPYGASTSLNVPTAREAYIPQYRKYPGSTSRDPSSVLNRYSYTPGISDQRRHWYDDHNMY